MMGDKKPFALRMNADMMRALERWASDEFRSVNGQIEWILNKALREAGRMKDKPTAEKSPKERE